VLDDIDGIPTHALLVHAVVVLLPLAALGGIAVVSCPPSAGGTAGSFCCWSPDR
jgi:hypothetical protein